MTPRKAALTNNTILTFIFLAINVALVSIMIPMIDPLLYEEDLTIIIPAFFEFIFFIMLMFNMFSWRKAIDRAYCPQCGEKYNFDEDIDWCEDEEIDQGNAIYSLVEYECCCGNCGHERTFTQKFRVANVDKNGNEHYHNIDKLVKDYVCKLAVINFVRPKKANEAAKQSKAGKPTKKNNRPATIEDEDDDDMMCPACGATFEYGIAFCSKCGTKLVEIPDEDDEDEEDDAMICPSCGETFESGTAFCTNCGTKLEERPAPEAPATEAPATEAPATEAAEVAVSEPTYKFCCSCGERAETAAQFCIKCGTAFDGAPKAPPQAAPKAAPKAAPDDEAKRKKDALGQGIIGMICPIVSIISILYGFNSTEQISVDILLWSGAAFILATLGLINSIKGLKAKIKVFGILGIIFSAIALTFIIMNAPMLIQIYQMLSGKHYYW